MSRTSHSGILSRSACRKKWPSIPPSVVRALHHDWRLAALRQALRSRAPRRGAPLDGLPPGTDPAQLARASVALVVRPEEHDLELLVIKRATRSGDPWSGHMAFPGGRRSAMDRTAQETAERETWEEVGIELSGSGRLVGPLDEVWPRAGAPAIVVAPFVFSVSAGTTTNLNHEVERTYWIPLRDLSAPGAATEYLHALADGAELRFPAIAYESHVIWGLTHRIMTGFLDTVRLAIAGEEKR